MDQVRARGGTEAVDTKLVFQSLVKDTLEVAGTFEISWTTIIEAGPTWDWRRTRRSLGPSSLPKPGVSFRFRRSADFIIVTSGAPPKPPHFKFSSSPRQR